MVGYTKRSAVLAVTLAIIFTLLLSTAYASCLSGSITINDCDQDGMPDAWELLHGLQNYSETSLGEMEKYEDLDKDGLANLAEYLRGSLPEKPDTDSDGFNDYVEWQYGTNSTNKSSIPNHSLINVSLVYPKYGASATNLFRNITIRVTNESQACKFSQNRNDNFSRINAKSQIFATKDNFNFYIESFTLLVPDGQDTTIYVKCNTTDGYLNELFPIPIVLRVDSTEPKFTDLRAVPDEVIERLEVTLNAHTDDKSVCRYDDAANIPPASEYYSYFNSFPRESFTTENYLYMSGDTDPAIEDNRAYTYMVMCMNEAGQMSDIGVINFSVNLSAEDRIISLMPQGYARGNTANLSVITNKDSSCFYSDSSRVYPFPEEYSKTHTKELRQLAEGAYKYYVTCNFADANVVGGEINFGFDNTAPAKPVITVSPMIYNTEHLSANFSSSDNTSGIAGYAFRVIGPNSTYGPAFTQNSSVEIQMELTSNAKYTWEVYAMDRAGNNGSSATAETRTYEINNAPTMLVNVTQNELSAHVSARCSDSDGMCMLFNYSAIDADSNCTYMTCNYIKIEALERDLTKNTTIYYNIRDNKNASANGSYSVVFETGGGQCGMMKVKYCSPDCTLAPVTSCNRSRMDSDFDGMDDAWELNYTLDPYTNDSRLDSDNDNLTNFEEYAKHTNPVLADTDGDGYSDKVEIEKFTNPLDVTKYPLNSSVITPPPVDNRLDTDKDGMTDVKEKSCHLDPAKDDSEDDNDEDGLTNKEECLNSDYDLNPNEADTDGDGYNDKAELDAGTDPTDPESMPKSHVLNIIMFIAGFMALGGGAFFFMQKGAASPPPQTAPQSMQQPNTPPPQQYPQFQQEAPQQNFVDFSYAKEQLIRQEEARMPPQENIDEEIRRKREELKMRKMTSVFDEFADGRPVEGKQQPPQAYRESPATVARQETSKKTYTRLDDISSEDAFEELEELSRKKKR